MAYSSVVKTGLGVGLLAVSLGVGATSIDGKHNFGTASIYVKQTATNTNYTAFLPSGNQSTDSVIVVEHNQPAASTAPMTWTYMLPVTTLGGMSAATSPVVSNPAMSTLIPGGSLIGSLFNTNSAASSWTAYSGTASTSSTMVMPNFILQNHGQGIWTGATQYGQTYTGVFDAWHPIAYPFSYSTVVSSQQCNVSNIAVIDQNDYLQWGDIRAQPASTAGAGWQSASAAVSVFWGTQSTTTAAGPVTNKTFTEYLSTIAASLWNNPTASNVFSTFSAANATLIIPNGASAYATFVAPDPAVAGAGTSGTTTTNATSAGLSTYNTTGFFTVSGTGVNNLVKSGNSCGAASAARAALNGAGTLVIGGRNGLMRLW